MRSLLRDLKFSSKRQLAFIGFVLFLLGTALLGFSLSGFAFLGKEKIYIQLREAEEYLRQNSKESARRALQSFNHILANDVNRDINQKAKYGMAAALELLEENAAALRYYRELKKEEIKDTMIRDKLDYSLGRIYLYLNHESEGRSLLDALLLRTKDKILKSKVFTAFGMYYLRRNECKRAEENFRVALKYDQENLKAAEGRAAAIKSQGRDWIAYRYYDDYLFGAANLDPKNRKEVVNKVEKEIFDSGIQAFRKGRYHHAISFFKKVCRGTEDKHIEENARFWIAESYKALGLNKKAIKLYSSVLNNSIREKDDVALFKKGLILFQENKIKEAAKVFSELHTGYPDSEYSQKAKEYIDDIHEERIEKSGIENNVDDFEIRSREVQDEKPANEKPAVEDKEAKKGSVSTPSQSSPKDKKEPK